MRRVVPRWRKMTWVLLIWTVIFAVWIVGGVASNPSVSEAELRDCTQGGFFTEAECRETLEAAGDVGTGIGVALVFFLWFIGFIVLSLVWFMSRPRRASAPS